MDAPTAGEVLAYARERLRVAGVASPDLDARLLVGDSLGLDPAALILRSGDRPDQASRDLIELRLARRVAGEPVHRILGRRWFCEHEFQLSPDTLEPRPDTEAVVELAAREALAVIRSKGACFFADIGTGSGAIAVSLLARLPETLAVATDISEGALRTARGNAATAGVAARFMPVAGSYLEAIGRGLDLVVSNPPYIPSADIIALAREVRSYDPPAALDGGIDGLDAYRALARQCSRVLRPGSGVVVEIGWGQGRDVTAIFRSAGLHLAASADDLAGVERALKFRSVDSPPEA